jgi:signal transduction histidine kinase
LETGDRIYAVQRFHESEADSVFFNHMEKLSLFSIPIAGVFLVLFGLIVWLLGRRLARPSQELAEWAKNLSRDKLDEPIPNFQFIELNSIAEELHQSMVRTEQFVEREREFLRQASHELRTPVTVIGGNAELLARHELKGPQNKIVNRIQRAASNMKGLIETLLWLGREINVDVGKETVDLVSLLSEILEELRYLADAKGVTCEVHLDAQSYPVEVLYMPLYIVVSNLVRNAFQHTPQGRVSIKLVDGELIIENHIHATPEQILQTQGKGVGLNLVAKVCQRCGWTITTAPLDQGGMCAILSLNEN